MLEIFGGILLFFISPAKLTHLTLLLTAHRLSANPHSWVALTLIHAVENVSLDSKFFASVYLLSHGLLKIFLVISLIREELWAYPTAMAILGVFVVYQSQRITYTHSMGLLVFTLFDTVIFFLVLREYRRLVTQQRAT